MVHISIGMLDSLTILASYLKHSVQSKVATKTGLTEMVANVENVILNF